MPRNFSLLPGGLAGLRNPRAAVRVLIAVLVFANLAAFALVLYPPGGSAEDLEREINSQRKAIAAGERRNRELKALADKVEAARKQGDGFMLKYFIDRRVASSTIVSELANAAKEAGMKPKEHAFIFDAVDGSDTVTMMNITANYEGTYSDLIHFVNRLDRSPRFLIIDSLTAAPQQQGGQLNVAVRINAFVEEHAAPQGLPTLTPAAVTAPVEPPAPGGPTQ
ncbi:MAG: hypothetical protein FJW40_08550 [Acidobacteria bacterium]|nr:hypothetical protein [Acidobacteriota bacterium]